MRTPLAVAVPIDAIDDPIGHCHDDHGDGGDENDDDDDAHDGDELAEQVAICPHLLDERQDAVREIFHDVLRCSVVRGEFLTFPSLVLYTKT